jgi:hypothetical protein
VGVGPVGVGPTGDAGGDERVDWATTKETPMAAKARRVERVTGDMEVEKLKAKNERKQGRLLS